MLPVAFVNFSPFMLRSQKKPGSGVISTSSRYVSRNRQRSSYFEIAALATWYKPERLECSLAKLSTTLAM